MGLRAAGVPHRAGGVQGPEDRAGPLLRPLRRSKPSDMIA
jgi:hypothetical protein